MSTNPGAPGTAEHERDVVRAHGYHALKVKRAVQETEDTKSYVLDVPEELRSTFAYEPGQFCTFRVRLGDEEHFRSYSMSSAPETDPDLTVTVKRVPGGVVSNWFLDKVFEGDVLELTRPAGVFCLCERNAPVVAFCGGSGVTPVMSIAKHAMVSTRRSVRMVYANRDAGSVIFRASLDTLEANYRDRIQIHHHLDCDSGFLDAASVSGLVGDRLDADFYICGPGPFMDLVESTILEMGAAPSNIFIERFLVEGQTSAPSALSAAEQPDTAVPETVTVIMKGKRTAVGYQPGDTLLETARRGALQPPFSCESGSCATCMAILREGSAKMRVNDALTAEEVAEGWVLTCQAVPDSPTITVEYESF